MENNLFIRDLGDTIALTECRKTIVSLKVDNKLCYNDIKLNEEGYLNKESHVILFNSSTRPCYKHFPHTVIKTLDGNYVAQEPSLFKVEVQQNVSILGNLSYNFNFDNSMEFMEHNQGLATSEEWHSLAEQIQYSGLRDVLSEDLFTSLCLDSQHCNQLISGIRPSQSYNPTVLNIPSPEEIQESIMKKMNLNIWDKITQWINKFAAEICLFTLAFQSLILILTLIDFVTSQNESNMLRVLIRLFSRLIIKFAQCFCKLNWNGKIASRQLRNGQHLVQTNDLDRIHWKNDNEILPSLELQPLNSNRVFATLEDL